MTSEEVGALVAARENLARRRGELASEIAGGVIVSTERARELTTILEAIEAVDRALVATGHPYLSGGRRTPQPKRQEQGMR